MHEQNNIIIVFSEKADSVLLGIEKKHSLEEVAGGFSDFEDDGYPKEVIIINITKDFVLEKISNTEFVEALHKELKISKEVTKNLAVDIVDNLIPLLEKIPEDQLEEYNRKKRPGGENRVLEISGEEKKEAFKKAKEDLLKKIGTRKIAQEPPSFAEAPKGEYKKTPDIKDVEDNAKNMENNLERPAAPQKEVAPAPPKSADPYKEQIQ